MKKHIDKIFFLFLLPLLFIVTASNFSIAENPHEIALSQECNLYEQLQLSKLGLRQEVFEKALKGWNTLFKNQHLEKPSVLSIADLSQSANSKRLYVIDMQEKKLLYHTYVAHGRNSGEEFAHSFSNQINSFQSSLGFYITDATYQGTHGLSLKLKGVETGINDNAEERGIVVHGADYVNELFIKQNGRLGRSQGCPAVPPELCEPIINTIQGGSCLFMFYPDNTYLSKSALL